MLNQFVSNIRFEILAAAFNQNRASAEYAGATIFLSS